MAGDSHHWQTSRRLVSGPVSASSAPTLYWNSLSQWDLHNLASTYPSAGRWELDIYINTIAWDTRQDSRPSRCAQHLGSHRKPQPYLSILTLIFLHHPPILIFLLPILLVKVHTKSLWQQSRNNSSSKCHHFWEVVLNVGNLISTITSCKWTLYSTWRAGIQF